MSGTRARRVVRADYTRWLKARRLAAAGLGIIAAMVCTNSAGAAEPEVARWQPCDFAFRSATRHDNPFQVPFSATVKGPNGAKFTTPGFYDGDGTWKVRVAPNAEGKWSLTTRSEDPRLEGKGASFVCVPNNNPKVHGGLRVDPENPRHFVFDDGSRFFLLGYECDWLWALDTKDPSLPTLNRFLDKLSDHGFNYILLNGYAHDTSWRPGKTGDDDYGPPPMYAWQGTNEQPDHSRFNLLYWQHYDRMMGALYQRGIIAHLMVKVYNKQVNWPARESAEEDLYFRWLVARYAAYPNVVWDFSKEAHNEKNLEYKLGRLQWVRKHDPYKRPVTVHDDDGTYDSGAYDKILDYRSDQQHSNWHAKILDQRQRRDWPVVNVEFGYEHGPEGIEDKTYRGVQPPEEVCRRAWEIYTAGGYGAYYYTYTAWDVLRPEATPPGYAYFRHLHDFFKNTQYWRMKPSDHLVSEGYCLADPGKEYVVFLNQAKPFTLKLEGLAAPLRAEWYQPLTGKRADAGSLSAGERALAPPSGWGKGMVALHVGPAAAK